MKPVISDTGTDRLLTVPQLAEKLGLHPSKLYRLVEAGHIPYVRLPSEKSKGTIRFRESKVEAWLEAISVEASADIRVPPPAPRPMTDRAAECEALGIPVHHRFT